MLELQGLTRRYGDLVALDDLSFTVADGQLFGFVGPNGAGKNHRHADHPWRAGARRRPGPLARTTHDGRDAQTRRLYARGLRLNVFSDVRSLAGCHRHAVNTGIDAPVAAGWHGGAPRVTAPER